MTIVILFLLFLSCSGMNPNETSNGPRPGDDDYVPPGWSEPQLAFGKPAYFPVEVITSEPATVVAPGQYVNSDDFGIHENTDKLSGPPEGGGTMGPNNSSVVSLGMAGGSVTVRFDPPIENHPDNIGGYDFIVFGNAYWQGGNPQSQWQEPGVIRVMNDENGNGEPDDIWYLIPGSHLGASDAGQTVTYDDIPGGDLPPDDKISAWWPDGASSPISISDVFLLPDSLYNTGGAGDQCWGYCDVTPTLLLGDLSGADGNDDNALEDVEDYPGIDPVYFYTIPDTPGDRIIDPGSGGGDAIKLEWAVDPQTFEPVSLDEVSWIKIVSGTLTIGGLGEYSCEVDAVTRVKRSE